MTNVAPEITDFCFGLTGECGCEKKKGFTLIELLVVIAIIALLLSIIALAFVYACKSFLWKRLRNFLYKFFINIFLDKTTEIGFHLFPLQIIKKRFNSNKVGRHFQRLC